MFDFTLTPSLTIALVLVLGASAQWFAWRVNIPAILPLLLLGFLVGPVLGLINPLEALGENYLFPAVSLAVGLILFEGGLTLKLSEIRQTRTVVISLITLGALVTWLGAMVAGHYIIGLRWNLAALFGALIIVTGPTVIGPLIRNVRPNANISNILKWEGILIDPIGALVAVLVYEYIIIDSGGHAFSQTLWIFAEFMLVGTLIGAAAGFLLSSLLRRRAIPEYLINVISLALVFAIFALSNSVAAESGLLATTVMGTVMANRRVPHIEALLSFKEDLTILFISLLFIILAANIELEAFLQTLSWRSFLLLAVIMLLIRPANIFISALGSSLKMNEKLFLSWIAPRGIVAAAVTSLFASELAHHGVDDATGLIPLVFIVIVGTVALNSLTAKPVAEYLDVCEPDAQGFLIMGAHPVARHIAKFLQDEGYEVLVADTNRNKISAARMEGLNVYHGSPLSESSDDDLELVSIGRLLALTSNDEANALTSLKFSKHFGRDNVFQLASASGSSKTALGEDQRGRRIFYGGTSFIDLNTLFSQGAELKKTNITDSFTLKEFEQEHGTNYVPLFVIDDKGLKVVVEDKLELEPKDTLVSLVLTNKKTSAKAS